MVETSSVAVQSCLRNSLVSGIASEEAKKGDERKESNETVEVSMISGCYALIGNA